MAFLKMKFAISSLPWAKNWPAAGLKTRIHAAAIAKRLFLQDDAAWKVVYRKE
jgi:hypothetical protein